MDGGRVALGGTAAYSALAARRLGLEVAVVTACSEVDMALLDALRDQGVPVQVKASQVTTTFRNSYDAAGNRTQVLTAHAAGILPGDVPSEWSAAGIVHLGPVAQELSLAFPAMFGEQLLGITPQGWMRSWDAEGNVAHSAWPIPTALKNLPARSILVLSMEDLGHDSALASSYARLAPLVVITQGGGEALVYLSGEQYGAVPALYTNVVDPTGAGDVFAAALLVRYGETGDPLEAARFAHVTAARAIGRDFERGA